MVTAASFHEQAMESDEPGRAELVDRLYESITATTPEWEAAWLNEAKKRMAEIDAGEVEALPWDEARKILFASLDRE